MADNTKKTSLFQRILYFLDGGFDDRVDRTLGGMDDFMSGGSSYSVSRNPSKANAEKSEEDEASKAPRDFYGAQNVVLYDGYVAGANGPMPKTVGFRRDMPLSLRKELRDAGVRRVKKADNEYDTAKQHVGNFMDEAKLQLDRIDGYEPLPAGVTPEGLATVSKYLEQIRESNRTTVELTDGPEDTILLEYGNRALHFNGKESLMDGDEMVVYPIDGVYGNVRTSHGVKVKASLYKSDSPADFLKVKMPYKLAQKLFGEKYLSTELRLGLERGLPLKIERLGPNPASVKAAQIPLDDVYKDAESKALETLKSQVADVKKARSMEGLEHQIFDSALVDMKFSKNLYASTTHPAKNRKSVSRRKPAIKMGRGC